jgi:MFS family permease
VRSLNPLGVIAGALDPISTDYGLDSLMKGVVTSSVILGAMIGTIIGGIIADKIGRKKV